MTHILDMPLEVFKASSTEGANVHKFCNILRNDHHYRTLIPLWILMPGTGVEECLMIICVARESRLWTTLCVNG